MINLFTVTNEIKSIQCRIWGFCGDARKDGGLLCYCSCSLMAVYCFRTCCPEDEGSMFLQNVGIQPTDYVTQPPKITPSTVKTTYLHTEWLFNFPLSKFSCYKYWPKDVIQKITMQLDMQSCQDSWLSLGVILCWGQEGVKQMQQHIKHFCLLSHKFREH
jgi:hypothetical protein